MSTEKVLKSTDVFFCEVCDYSSNRKSQYNRHLFTPKHIKSTNVNEKVQKSTAEFICSCGKKYKERSGLWRHNTKCKTQNNYENKIENTEFSKEQFFTILKQNTELQQLLVEQGKTIIELSKNNQINSNNTTNSNNKAFNLNLFLNETCKDAMNIMDFVDSIKLQLSDLETVGKIGYVEGITNIINKNLKALDVSQRPVHCTDKKREVLYIKDENKWEKENEDKTKIRKAIKHIAHKNSKLISEFRELHPDCGKSISKYSDQFNKIVIEAMGGHGDNDTEKENKIIANISKNVTIEK